MKRQILAVAAAAGLVGAGLFTAPAAQAKTISACVKKSDGTVKFITKKNKKCAPGWVKKSWNTKGPQGATGPAGPSGPNWIVKDKNGVTLGVFSGYFAVGLLGAVMVTVDDGGAYQYGVDGTLSNNDASVVFVNNGCTDAAWFGLTNDALQPYLKAAGSTGRVVFQVTGAPTASAWKVATTTITTVPVGANTLFHKDATTGACAALGHPGGFIVPLTPAKPPVVAAPGALQIVR